MKDIMIKIVGKRFAGGEEEEQLEFISDGKMYERAGARYLIYEESEFSGLPGCKTRLKIEDKSVKLKRIGKDMSTEYGGELVFEQGKRFTSSYRTPYGSFDLEVLTKSVKNNLNEDGFGVVSLDYDVSFSGSNEDRNRIDIEIIQ